ncbi:MAG TPA: prolyl oligopeptidase family serine peptidase [Rhodothermales bacterium]|nr:prolyl oligopeptidase family serine peptidase [Rhodothermales bacterium]
MKYILFWCMIGFFQTVGAQRLPYPETRKTTQMDDYHGTMVSDPYRWLEDDHSLETAAWVEAQNRVTFDWLGKIPARDKIRERLTALWNYPRFSVPFTEGGKYFYAHNTGLQNQSEWFVQDRLDGPARSVINPNDLSADGTVALNFIAPSRNAQLVAYSTSKSGSDWQTIRVRDVSNGKDLPDLIEWVKFSGISWAKNNTGFYYSRYDRPAEGSVLQAVNSDQKVYYHKIGTPQSDDVLIYSRPDKPFWGFGATATDDGKFLIVSVWEGTDPKNRIYFKDLTHPNNEVKPLFDAFDASYDYIANRGNTFYFTTNLKAPNNRLIALDIRKPDAKFWRTIIPEGSSVMEGVSLIADQFVVQTLQDVKAQLSRYSLSGRLLAEAPLPGIGTVSGLNGKARGREMFFAFTSYTTPATIYRFDFNLYRTTVFRAPKVNFTPNDYETKQVFYTSKDGTRVPMFISHKKGMVLNGQNPTLLYGYGGFNVSMKPGFSASNLAWMEMGGVYAVANLRGGNEYGERWHQAGMLDRKQNVFDDFIAAAEFLIAQKYTTSPKLAIHGGSNGGLLVGAVVNQRPELFGAAIPAVGVMDMLRYHKFTIGWAWASEYGRSDDKEAFKVLYAYSPLHNIRSGTAYPATLIQTADHDDRVVPAHSFKYAATLQAAQGGSAPILLRVETKAGHGAGKPTAKIIEDEADKWTFLVKVLEMKY